MRSIDVQVSLRNTRSLGFARDDRSNSEVGDDGLAMTSLRMNVSLCSTGQPGRLSLRGLWER
jgi:hypothetical protein